MAVVQSMPQGNAPVAVHATCCLCNAQEAMEWFKANPIGGSGEEGGSTPEQYSVQDDNSDTSSVTGDHSTATTTNAQSHAGMGTSLACGAVGLACRRHTSFVVDFQSLLSTYCEHDCAEDQQTYAPFG